MTVSLRVFEHTCPAASDRIPGTILKPVTKKTQKNTNRKHKTISMVFQGEQAFEIPQKSEYRKYAKVKNTQKTKRKRWWAYLIGQLDPRLLLMRAG